MEYYKTDNYIALKLYSWYRSVYSINYKNKFIFFYIKIFRV